MKINETIVTVFYLYLVSPTIVFVSSEKSRYFSTIYCACFMKDNKLI